jgi:hypothetical protein
VPVQLLLLLLPVPVQLLLLAPCCSCAIHGCVTHAGSCFRQQCLTAAAAV